MKEELDISETADGIEISVLVQPQAGRTTLVGIHGGALKMRVAAPPVKGRATEECLRFLADLLGLRRSDVAVVAGLTSRKKRVRLRGVSREALRQALAEKRHGR